MTAEQLIKRIEQSGRKARGYSGRGMCGEYCVGVSLQQGDSGGELPRGASTDSLGKGSIWYWPSIAWPKERAE